MDVDGGDHATFAIIRVGAHLRQVVDRVAKSLDVNDLGGASDMASARIDRIYRRSKLRGVEWRKKVRRDLAKGWKAFTAMGPAHFAQRMADLDRHEPDYRD